ncbi:MAG TPA: methyl-coenzyme M reductase glutamine C-methyltransferase [Methanobacteriaceae archaeon]|jgi:tRNA-2-methylthio-N6-dimethylallyladenosine synthase|nr:methyl-coenzyme M reductase glutamine C-methyltransferase [Euryarchaeota archaeon]HNR25338.1 methyl-coenzyme M reductase glutamine C-methyltransferase [Methanobacteriaceae archaeon]HNS24759.1 methyl-coenzyme M reductase glutamine C-methyltransferase [Methanobacteriaceae archaeon]
MRKDWKITILTPEFYTYGSMVIGGVLGDAGYSVALHKGFQNIPKSDVIFISLQSTIHLLKYRDPILKLPGYKILGGPVTHVPELALELLPVDMVLQGEGEVTVLKIMEELESTFQGNSTPKMKSENDLELVEKNPKIVKGTSSSLIRPIPLIPDDIGSESIRGANVYIETHRGCPGNCGFCQVPCFFGRKVRSRPAADIINEVRTFMEKGTQRIAISGGTGSLYGSPKFNQVDEQAFGSLLKEISNLTSPPNLTIPDIRVDMINDDILDSIRKYTNKWVYFGIESGSEKVLKHMKKGINLDEVRSAVESARKYGLKIAGSFIVAYPGEEEEDFQDTLDFADELMLDDYFISIAEPLPGTDLKDKIKQIPSDENALFIPGEKYKKYGLSVAEERALEFMLESYVYRSLPQPMTANLFKALLDEVKAQGKHIRTVTSLLIGCNSYK